jgi:mycofactocin precursor
MRRLEGRDALVTGLDSGTYTVREEGLPKQTKVASDKENVEEKPRASEEIVIEEISIDGMCGVY